MHDPLEMLRQAHEHEDLLNPLAKALKCTHERIPEALDALLGRVVHLREQCAELSAAIEARKAAS